MPNRDHLFISYAWEDAALAEWLTLKLTGLGYRVWCDRFKLLGGESYPRDIDVAIKDQTFRLLALLSAASINKPNPMKERTLAVNLSIERKEDFLIPLNVDGISPTGLDWRVSDLTYIPFSHSWSAGLTQLLKKLESLGAPKSEAAPDAVRRLFDARSELSPEPEPLWTNFLPILQLPERLLYLRSKSGALALPAGWPSYLLDTNEGWVLEVPDSISAVDVVSREESVHDRSFSGPNRRDVLAVLLRRYLERRCRSMGLSENQSREFYFPLDGDTPVRLPFTHHSGRRSYIQTVGYKTFATKKGRVRNRHHLVVSMRPHLDRFGVPLVSVGLRVFITDPGGFALTPSRVNARRKKIVRDWFNHEWWSRTVAVADWFSGGKSTIDPTIAQTDQLVLSGQLLKLTSPIGLVEPVDASASDSPRRQGPDRGRDDEDGDDNH